MQLSASASRSVITRPGRTTPCSHRETQVACVRHLCASSVCVILAAVRLALISLPSCVLFLMFEILARIAKDVNTYFRARFWWSNKALDIGVNMDL